MTNDPNNPFSAPLATPSLAGQQPGSLPSLAGGGSLAQAARLKQIKVARGIMFALGGLFIVGNLLMYPASMRMMDEEIDKEVQKVQRNGTILNMDKVAEFKASAHRSLHLVLAGTIAIGIMYIVFGFIVNKYPVPITIIALVVFIGFQIILAIADPNALWQGLIMKAIILVGLGKAIQAGIAYQSAEKEMQLSNAGWTG